MQPTDKSIQTAGWFPALFELGMATDPGNICHAITKAISHEWTADLCLMLSPPGPHGNMKIVCGYDLIREQSLGGISINSQAIPVIASAMRRGRSLRLPANSTSPDLVGLEQVLEIQQIGHLLAVPINDPDGNQLAGIILLTPYTKRSWTADDQLRLSEYALPLAQLLQHTYRLTTLRSDFEETRAELAATQQEMEKLHQENVLLLSRLGSEPGNDSNQRLQTVSLAALLAAHKEAQDTIAKLRAENARLQKDNLNVSASTPTTDSEEGLEPSYAEGEMRLALEEVARLRIALSEADQKMLEMHKELSSASPSIVRVREIIALAQELRQPMTSIVGYTDFLLGESIGILGTLQRRFLERIRTSADRMRRLVDNLLTITGGEYSSTEGANEKFDLSSVIDDAVTRTGGELRDRSIALRMDLPKHMPALNTDRRALEKLLVVLLENAGLVTPVDGEISLRVQLKRDMGAYDYVLIQVADQGGGISSEDLSLLFTEVQPTEPIVIAGLSERVADITDAKDLAESLGGRLWVDSELGYGATFSLLFPVSMAEPAPEIHGGYD
jgi:signal transduction histidine kinase